jgi:hypothetical protein
VNCDFPTFSISMIGHFLDTFRIPIQSASADSIDHRSLITDHLLHNRRS